MDSAKCCATACKSVVHIVFTTQTAGNRNSRTLQLHVLASGASLGTPIEGAPRVDAIFPEDNGKDIMVTTQVEGQGARGQVSTLDNMGTP